MHSYRYIRLLRPQELLEAQELQELFIAQEISLAEAQELSKIQSKQAKIVQPYEVIEKIQAHEAIVKVIESKCDDNTHWEFLLQQLAYPDLYRPVMPLGEAANRSLVFNTFTGEWTERKISGARGRYKNTAYTKKTASTLIPRNGRIQLYNPDGVNAGVLFDLKQCKYSGDESKHSERTKDHPKYAFTGNMITNNRWWIAGQPGSQEISSEASKEIINQHKTVSWLELRIMHNSYVGSSHIPKHNEILTRFSKDGLNAIFTPKNYLTDRLNALHKKFLTKRWLQVDLPVFIITPQDGVLVYEDDQIIKDILMVMHDKSKRPYGYAFILEIIRDISFYKKDLWQKILTKIHEDLPNDLPKEFWLYEALQNKLQRKDKESEINTIMQEVKLADGQRYVLVNQLCEAKLYVPKKISEPLLLGNCDDSYKHLLTMIKQQYFHAAEYLIDNLPAVRFTQKTLVEAFKFLLAFGKLKETVEESSLAKKIFHKINEYQFDTPLGETTLANATIYELLNLPKNQHAKDFIKTVSEKFKYSPELLSIIEMRKPEDRGYETKHVDYDDTLSSIIDKCRLFDCSFEQLGMIYTHLFKDENRRFLKMYKSNIENHLLRAIVIPDNHGFVRYISPTVSLKILFYALENRLYSIAENILAALAIAKIEIPLNILFLEKRDAEGNNLLQIAIKPACGQEVKADVEHPKIDISLFSILCSTFPMLIVDENNKKQNVFEFAIYHNLDSIIDFFLNKTDYLKLLCQKKLGDYAIQLHKKDPLLLAKLCDPKQNLNLSTIFDHGLPGNAGKNILHILLEEKSVNHDLIKRIINEVPCNKLVEANNEGENCISLAFKYGHYDELYYMMISLSKSKEHFGNTFIKYFLQDKVSAAMIIAVLNDFHVHLTSLQINHAVDYLAGVNKKLMWHSSESKSEIISISSLSQNLRNIDINFLKTCCVTVKRIAIQHLIQVADSPQSVMDLISQIESFNNSDNMFTFFEDKDVTVKPYKWKNNQTGPYWNEMINMAKTKILYLMKENSSFLCDQSAIAFLNTPTENSKFQLWSKKETPHFLAYKKLVSTIDTTKDQENWLKTNKILS